ncbi:Eco29kI family restriction endonuclease [Novosphingobium sp.]|uniref:Eco29kI family restriction endonuclease n=1 Tax=Novosphingobium sp. TaxID=1874826 RepID=UPI0025DCD355|nr:Eco29kI family restriction endonuclease [Novosphingobium sp.]MCC6924543.1 Eco29kI family restriction endonuclease [Novosphingobium sp.]
MNSQNTAPGSVGALRESLERLTADASDTSLSNAKRKKLETQIKEAIDELTALLAKLDPIAQPTSIFDPSNPKVVGRFVALAMVAQESHPLSDIPKFYGSGVYAIYYKGSFPAYQHISGTETPIYVGKASPSVSNARSPIEQGAKLSGRLNDHRKNIAKAVGTLDLADFEFRSLVVQSGWETAAEDYLIHLFQPIWNSETNILYGLGKHGDAATTRANKRSPWDTLHPGRAWAAASAEDAKSVKQVEAELVRHFAKHPVYPNLQAVLANFIGELRQG